MGKGETEVIALALELKADAILIDETAGREEAQRAGLLILPTLAVLERAAAQKLLDLPTTTDCLSQTTFRVAPKLLQEVLARDQQRKQAEESN